MTCKQITGGFECEKGKSITISSPLDPNNPLSTHSWLVDGVQASTQQQFIQTIATNGQHTVEHTGYNACGSQCAQTAQLNIVDVVTPPARSTAAPASSLPIILVGLTVVGLIGVVVLKSK